MTYLAGLDAHTVVWIARAFTDQHRAAVVWLNENTADKFRFFAVIVRAVKIGDSPIAPVFDIAAKPNEWTKQLKQTQSSSGSKALWTQLRLQFWTFYIERFPDEAAHGPASATIQRWTVLSDADLVVATAFNKSGGGVYLRGRAGVQEAEVFQRLLPYVDRFLQRTGAVVQSESSNPYIAKWYPDSRIDVQNKDNWPALADWLHSTSQLFLATIRELIGTGE